MLFQKHLNLFFLIFPSAQFSDESVGNIAI